MRILVVDDNADIRLLVTMLLTARGFDVDEAIDGLTALAAVRGPAVHDLVLLDIRMPAPDGLEVLDTVRAEGIPVKVVMISAHADSEPTVAAHVRKADAFLRKPFTSDDLYDTIDRVLSEGAV